MHAPVKKTTLAHYFIIPLASQSSPRLALADRKVYAPIELANGCIRRDTGH